MTQLLLKVQQHYFIINHLITIYKAIQQYKEVKMQTIIQYNLILKINFRVIQG
jgi:hypothetical protein